MCNSRVNGNSHIYYSRKHNIPTKYFKEWELTMNIVSFAAASKDGIVGTKDGGQLTAKRVLMEPFSRRVLQKKIGIRSEHMSRTKDATFHKE